MSKPFLKAVPDARKKSGPVETKTVTINNDEQVIVDKRAEEYYYAADPTVVNDSALRCTKCGFVTIHSGYEFRVLNAVTDEPEVIKRVYACSTCGHTSIVK